MVMVPNIGKENIVKTVKEIAKGQILNCSIVWFVNLKNLIMRSIKKN